MTIELILLGLASTMRPAALAAVYALACERSASRLISAYSAAGLVFTIAFGVLMVTAFRGIQLHAGSDHTKGIAEIAGGALALSMGVGVLSGRLGKSRPDRPSRAQGRLGRLRERSITTRTAALAGPITHLPGLLYIIALDLIVSAERQLADGVLTVVAFNALWFAIPLGALAISIVNPALVRDAIGALNDWTRAHSRTLLLAICFGLGGVLLISGLFTV